MLFYFRQTPDDNKRTVLSKGNSKGLIASIPIGGHWAPNSTVGDNALWKKAQNMAKKNSASDNINSATPMFNPLWTANVWLPKYVASLITSRHHKAMDKTTVTKADIKNVLAWVNECIVNTPLVVKVNNAIDVYNGQGDGDTKWKGWPWNRLLCDTDTTNIKKYSKKIQVIDLL